MKMITASEARELIQNQKQLILDDMTLNMSLIEDSFDIAVRDAIQRKTSCISFENVYTFLYTKHPSSAYWPNIDKEIIKLAKAGGYKINEKTNNLYTYIEWTL